MPVVSVLLPFRNAGRTLEEAASSILADVEEDDSLVLVDDGSTDNGAAIARGLASGDSRVRLVSSGGIGIAGALNAGLAECRGDYIARMDGDDVSLPGRVAAERSMLESEPSLGVVATQIELFSSSSSLSSPPGRALLDAPPLGEGIQRYAAWQNGLVTSEEHARAIFIESPVCHPSSMIRRTAIDAVGGYREGPFAEDYDLWLRLVQAGWGIAKVPRVLFRWRIHPTSLTWTDPRFSPEFMRRLRAMHLAKRMESKRPFAMWGAGPAGRRLARELEAYALRTSFFIDIDPRKIGRTARGVPIVSVDDGIARVKAQGALLIVAVAARGARDLVRAKLDSDDVAMCEGRDYLCAI